jgi:hypothetical protein
MTPGWSNVFYDVGGGLLRPKYTLPKDFVASVLHLGGAGSDMEIEFWKNSTEHIGSGTISGTTFTASLADDAVFIRWQNTPDGSPPPPEAPPNDTLELRLTGGAGMTDFFLRLSFYGGGGTHHLGDDPPAIVSRDAGSGAPAPMVFVMPDKVWHDGVAVDIDGEVLPNHYRRKTVNAHVVGSASSVQTITSVRVGLVNNVPREASLIHGSPRR